MEAFKRVRTSHRSAFTRILNQLNELLQAEVRDEDEIVVTFELLQEKLTELESSSNNVLNHILTCEESTKEPEKYEALYESESISTDDYKKIPSCKKKSFQPG